MIQKALQEEPENSAYLDSMGWVLFKRGKLKEALEPLKKAAELHEGRAKKGDARRHDPRAPRRRVLPAPGRRQGRGLLGAGRARSPRRPSRRTSGSPEIRKKLEALEARPQAEALDEPSP